MSSTPAFARGGIKLQLPTFALCIGGGKQSSLDICLFTSTIPAYRTMKNLSALVIFAFLYWAPTESESKVFRS